MNQPESPPLPTSWQSLSTRGSVARWGRHLLTWTVMVVTLYLVAGHIQNAIAELRSRPLTLDLLWLSVGVTTFVVGMILLSVPWYLIVQDQLAGRSLARLLPFVDTSRVFIISQVGKYVPGKAVVLLIRYGMLRARGGTLGFLALTSFFETLSTMSAAALVGIVAVGLPTSAHLHRALDEYPWVRWSALGVFAMLSLPILPPIYRHLPKLLGVLLPSALAHGDQAMHWRTFGSCLVVGAAAWCVLGISFWACVAAVAPTPLAYDSILPLTGVFCLAYVAGFLSMTPGHLGVRDAIMLIALEELTGGDKLTAVSATLLSRSVTLVGEALLAASLYLTFRDHHANLLPVPPDPSPPGGERAPHAT